MTKNTNTKNDVARLLMDLLLETDAEGFSVSEGATLQDNVIILDVDGDKSDRLWKITVEPWVLI